MELKTNLPSSLGSWNHKVETDKNKIIIDQTLDSESTHGISNKAVTTALNQHQSLIEALQTQSNASDKKIQELVINTNSLMNTINNLGTLSKKNSVSLSDLDSGLMSYIDKQGYVKSVSGNFTVSEKGELSLKSVSTDIIENGENSFIIDGEGANNSY